MVKAPAHVIARALCDRHASRGDFFMTQVKSGPTWAARRGELLVFDALAVRRSWSRPCVTIYEIKTSRQDFLNDEKWPRYREYCNRFYFACPAGLISPDELSPGIGLVAYDPAGKNPLRTVRMAVMADTPIPPQMFMHIVISKLEQERHPFFSNAREYFEAMVHDRGERASLGDRVRSRLNSDNRLLRIALADTRRELSLYRSSHERFKELLNWFRRRQFSVYNNESLLAQLENMLDSPRAQITARQALDAIEGELVKGGRL